MWTFPFVRAGFTSGKRRTKKNTWNFGGPRSAKLQAIPKRNRTTGSHQKIHPKSNSPSYILVKSSVSTVLNILVFLPRGFSYLSWKKKRKNRDTSTNPIGAFQRGPFEITPLLNIIHLEISPRKVKNCESPAVNLQKGPNRKGSSSNHPFSSIFQGLLLLNVDKLWGCILVKRVNDILKQITSLQTFTWTKLPGFLQLELQYYCWWFRNHVITTWDE